MKYFSLLVAALLLVSCGGSADNESSANLSPIMKKALYDKGSLFYADFENYPKDKSQLPIGVFDSGTGGLTVLEASGVGPLQQYYRRAGRRWHSGF